MSARAYHRLPTPGERLLAVAGDGERLTRALLSRLRRLRPGRRGRGLPGVGEDLARVAAAARRNRATRLTGPAAAEGDPRPDQGAGGPLLWLAALPWHFRFQRPQQLALAMAATAAAPPAVYLEAFARHRLQPRLRLLFDEPRLQVVRLAVPGRPDPHRQPFPEAAVPALVTELLAALSAPPAAVVAQLPFWAPLAAEIARRTGALLVYDRIDLHTAFPGVPAAVGEVERELMAGCDLVTASSEALASEPRRLGVPVRVLPNAVVPEDFPAAQRAHRAQVPRAVRRAQGAPTAPSAGDRPVAGMVGALDGRVDAEALAAAARALPGWELRLAGGVEDGRVGELARLPNVSLAGEIPHHRVPAFLAGLDVGLVPYRDLPWTRAIDPVKLYEMLAAGRPVVARRLPALERWAPPLVYLYDRPEELPEAIAAAHQEDGDEPRRRRREAAGEESWRRRAAELLAALTAAAR